MLMSSPTRFQLPLPARSSVARHDPMRIAVEVLGGELEELRILQRFELMHQALRDVEALARSQLEALAALAVRGLLQANQQFSGAKVERFGLELVKMKRAFL